MISGPMASSNTGQPLDSQRRQSQFRSYFFIGYNPGREITACSNDPGSNHAPTTIYTDKIVRTSNVGGDYREHERAGQPKCRKPPVSLLFFHILAISIPLCVLNLFESIPVRF